MSALAGAFARDGSPVDRAALTRISSGLRQMGPDGEWIAAFPGTSLVLRPFHTDAVSRGDGAPILVREGYAVALDGRIDNGAEVRSALNEASFGSRGVDLVLSVYRQWGIAGFARLVGDFALAIRDPHEDIVVLCTDGLGRRPLFYHEGPSTLHWASAGLALLDALRLPRDLDEEYVADFLANRVSSASPFRSVSVVPGGHALIAGKAGSRLVRYWAPDPAREIRYRTDREYEEHFAGVFRDAVACRTDSDRPVVCELSGGVDSSTIACVADSLVREGRVATPGLHTLSYIYPESATADERPFIRSVEEALGRQGIHLPEEDAPQYSPLPAGLRPDFPAGALAFQARSDRVGQEMRRLGARVLLSGMGGDQVLWSAPAPGLPASDLLAAGRPLAAVRTASTWSRELRLPYLPTLWAGGILPLLPHGWQARLQKDVPVGEWIAPDFVKRTGLRARMLPLPDDVGFSRPSAGRQYGFVRRAMRIFALERPLSEGYVEIRHPYLDRRLVEFALAIPLEQMVRPRESRSIVRRALRGAVPSSVLERRSKAGPTEAFHRALAREWPRMWAMAADSRVAALGYVDADALRTALRRARHGIAENQVQLRKTLGLELWLRALESTGPPDDPCSRVDASRADALLQPT